MFGRMMNSYYYGKSGKGDYRKEDLPKNRWQLFWEMLRIRLSGVCRMNLMTCILWIPLMIVVVMFVNSVVAADSLERVTDEATGNSYIALVYEEDVDENGNVITPAMQASLSAMTQSILMLMIPCLAILGPAQAGMAYVMRNWARDEHAFPWADFRDAVKENWKQALGVSIITGLFPFVLFICYNFYGSMADDNLIFMIPQMFTLILGVLWCLGLVFMYPLMVTYKMKFGQLIKNGVMLAVARLPMVVGIRLVTLIPALIAFVVVMFWGQWLYALLALGLYYLVCGNGLTRFVYASFTNAVFDKYINVHIEGVEVNRGMAKEEDDDDLEDYDDQAEEDQSEGEQAEE